MRIISIYFIALLTVLPMPALSNGADPRISTRGMQSLYISYDADRFKTPTLVKTPTLAPKAPSAAPPKSVPEIAMSNAKMKAIWDEYKALVTAQSAPAIASAPPQQKAVTQKSANAPSMTQPARIQTPSASGFGASSVIERYQKARKASQQMHSLSFKPPQSLQKSQ